MTLSTHPSGSSRTPSTCAASAAPPVFLRSLEALGGRTLAEGRAPARPRLVALGGGTGLPVVLRGLKAALAPAGAGGPLSATDRDRLTAIVTVADDGGSSGRLRRRIRRVRLQPAAAALPQALEAIRRADCIVIGPGSLYTSLIPVLLTRGLVEAIVGSGVRVVLVMNLMTEPGETDGYSAADHLMALRVHAPRLPVHDVILNAAPPADPERRPYG